MNARTELEDDHIDDEVLEIFIEEIEEVLETIGRHFHQWQADLDDEEALIELRKAFHTLKVSSRMVGATVLGALAWSIEDMLNRVLDNSIRPGISMVSLTADVILSVPGGLEYFKNRNQQAFKVDEMIARANAIAAGKDATDTGETDPPKPASPPF